jgi:hypothetical protein
MLWLLWAIVLTLVVAEYVAAYVVPRRQHAWHAAQTAVAGFVLALLSLAAIVGTFALRETLMWKDVRAGVLDPRSPVGLAHMRRMLLSLWALCLLIGFFGNVVAFGAATPALARPYVLAAMILLVVHAPREWLFQRPTAKAETPRA